MSALPEYPPPYDPTAHLQLGHTIRMLDAALARLHEGRNRGWLQHLGHCDHARNLPCSCGLDELLADLLPGGE